MARLMCVIAVLTVGSAVVQTNQCSSGGECQSNDYANSAVSLVQTKLQMKVEENDAKRVSTVGVGDVEPVIESIRELLKAELGGMHFTYIVNPGNAGDALIQHGTVLLFDDLGLEYDVATPQQTFTNTTLVYPAAGNFLEGFYTPIRDFLERNSPPSRGNRIILLPATIQGYKETLSKLSSNVLIFTRDRHSYGEVQMANGHAEVLLSHDMAFYVKVLDPMLKEFRRLHESPASGVGYMLRTDGESVLHEQKNLYPKGNRDLSTEGKTGNGEWLKWAPDKDMMLATYKNGVQQVAHHVLKAVASYEEIWTDRLHMCIASALVGVKAYCMDNSYGKVLAVFDMSIRDKFPNMSFAGTPRLEPWKGPQLLQLSLEAYDYRGFAFAVGSILVTIVSMGGLRLLEQISPSEYLSQATFAVDVTAWYVMTAVYMVLSQQILRYCVGSDVILLASVQVFLGGMLLPLGEPRKLATLTWQPIKIFVFSGFVFFMGCFLALETLLHTNVLFLSNVRALEPVLTVCLMVLCGGANISIYEGLCLLFAVGGIFMALDPKKLYTLVGGPVSTVMFDLGVAMMANLAFSLRNIVLSQSADLLGSVPKIMVFSVTCLCALPPGLCLFYTSIYTKGSSGIDSGLIAHPWLVAVSATSFMLYNFASFLVLMRCRPVRHGVLINGKRIASVLLACILARETPTLGGLVGLAVTTAGVAMFEFINKSKATAQKEGVEKIDEGALPAQIVLATTHSHQVEGCKKTPVAAPVPTTLIQKLLLSNFGFILASVVVAVCSFVAALRVMNVDPSGPADLQ